MIQRQNTTKNVNITDTAKFQNWDLTFQITYEAGESNIQVNVSGSKQPDENGEPNAGYFYANMRDDNTSFNFTNTSFDGSLVMAVIAEMEEISMGKFEDDVEEED